MHDSKAKKILFTRYWSSKGWSSDRSINAEDFAYAKSAGYMFDEEVISHDESIKRAVVALSKVDRDQVATAFVSSLSSRRLDLRSALGSYAIGRHLTPHAFAGKTWCEACGANDSESPEDLSVLNFERLKWGGVRHGNPIYMGLDLELFYKTELPKISKTDIALFRRILDVIDALPQKARVRDLEKSLVGVFKSNKAERETFLTILGYAGVLDSPDHPGFLNQFIPACRREIPSVGKIDWNYPIAWWRGSNGINQNALEYWFPMVD